MLEFIASSMQLRWRYFPSTTDQLIPLLFYCISGFVVQAMCKGVQRSSGILFYIRILKTFFLLKYYQILYQQITCPKQPWMLLYPSNTSCSVLWPILFLSIFSHASIVCMPLPGKDRKNPRQKDNDLLSEVAFVQGFMCGSRWTLN